jgi:hypothetical protein
MQPSSTAREAEIVSYLDIPSSDPTRLGKTDVMITYRIDPLHTFSITMPKEAADEDTIRKAIQADWDKRKHIIGAKISLT